MSRFEGKKKFKGDFGEVKLRVKRRGVVA